MGKKKIWYICIRTKPVNPVGMGMGIGVVFEHSLDMGMGMSMHFENGYG